MTDGVTRRNAVEDGMSLGHFLLLLLVRLSDWWEMGWLRSKETSSRTNDRMLSQLDPAEVGGYLDDCGHKENRIKNGSLVPPDTVSGSKSKTQKKGADKIKQLYFSCFPDQ